MPAVLDRLHTERASLLDTIDTVARSADEDDRDLSTAELELIARHRDRIDTELDPQISSLEAVEVSRAAHANRAPMLPTPPGSPAPHPEDAPATVYRTYSAYARDVILSRYDNIAALAGAGSRDAAMERLSRAVANTISADVGGLIPPQHLAQLFDVISTSRPIVESSRRVSLTSGKLQYPDIAQRPQVGKQTAEKTEAVSRKMIVNMVEVVADTYVGAGDISWQAINWSTPDALALWFDLMAEEYARQTEAAAGTVLVAIPAVATPIDLTDLAAAMATIVGSAGAIYAASGRRANTVYADVASGYTLAGLVSASSPVFVTGGQFSLASGSGNVAGLNLVVSTGLPADTVLVADSNALLCAETAGAPVELRAVEPALGGMEVGIIGAFVAKVVDTLAFQRFTVAP